jgi:hypothetical protein
MSDDRKTFASAREHIDPELGRILHPARYFRHPREVVQDATLSTAEKRAILSSWASDACAVESTPALRELAGSSCAVLFDDVIDALRELDWRGRDDVVSVDEAEHKGGSQSGGDSENGPKGGGNWV